MKRIFKLIVILSLFSACDNSGEAESSPEPFTSITDSSRTTGDSLEMPDSTARTLAR